MQLLRRFDSEEYVYNQMNARADALFVRKAAQRIDNSCERVMIGHLSNMSTAMDGANVLLTSGCLTPP